MTQDKPHTGLRAATLDAAKAEYARWGTGCDTSRPDGRTSWVARQNDDGSWHEVSSHASLNQAEHECRDRALDAALSAAAPAPDKAGDREGVERAARVLLDACYKDYGRPDPITDKYHDDGPVGSSAMYDMALTFKMMRDLEDALAALTTGNETPSAGGAIPAIGHGTTPEQQEAFRRRYFPTPDSPAPAPSGAERERDIADALKAAETLIKAAYHVCGTAPSEAQMCQLQSAADWLAVCVDTPRPAPTGSGEPDSRAGVERWGVEEFGRTVWVGRLRPGSTEMSRVVYRVGIEGYGEEFANRVRSDAKLIVDSVNAALQSAPIASVAAGAVGEIAAERRRQVEVEGPDLPQEIRDLHEARLKARTAYHEADGTWSQLSLAAHRFDAACKEWVEQLLATPTPDPHPVPAKGDV